MSGTWKIILISIAACLFGGFLVFAYILSGLPNPEQIGDRQVVESTKILDRTGEVLLYEIFGEEKRTIIPFEEIPDYVKKGAIAVEDENFYTHNAFDFKSLIRAFLVNLRQGRVVQGGSTITQQLAKKLFLTDDRTIIRKIKELVLAFQLEKRYTKDEILNLYLNQIPFGSNAYGIEAASKTLFLKSAKDLSLAEAATLVSLPKAPSYYSPWGPHRDELLARKDLVLKKMLELGHVTESQYQTAKKQRLEFPDRPAIGIQAPHFVIEVQKYLNEKYGEEFVRTGGLKVITTLDWNLQQVAEKSVEEGAKRNAELYNGKNSALVAEDAKTGQILALVGSRNYFDTEIDGNFNVATQGLRQPGSAIKPFAYLTAFMKGYTPDTVLFDVPTEFDATKIPERSYKPGNFDGLFRGPVKLRTALAQSINVPAVKILYLAGIDPFLRLVSNFGISTLTERGRYGLSLVLGGGEVKLVELVHAYTVFAQEGVKHEQSMVLRVEDRGGQILEEYQDQTEQIVDAQYIRMINDILSDTEERAGLFHGSLYLTIFPNHELALKTGTTNDYRDAWSIGYTPSLVVGVWAGNNDNTPMQQRGGSILAAVPILNSFLREALNSQPSETFTKPEQSFVDKPQLNGQYINDGQIHSILYYVDRRNPTGPKPEDPTPDSQFENWETGVLNWASTTFIGSAPN